LFASFASNNKKKKASVHSCFGGKSMIYDLCTEPFVLGSFASNNTKNKASVHFCFGGKSMIAVYALSLFFLALPAEK